MSDAPATLVTAGTVLAGPEGEVQQDGAVLLSGNTIEAVGPRAVVEQQAPAAAVTYRFPAGTLLPGLINAHVHLAFCGGGEHPVETLRAQTSDARLAMQMSRRAEILLRSGVTTVRDLGDRTGLSLEVREAITAGEIAGPRVLAATTPLTPPDGHCWFLGGQVVGEAGIREQVRHIATLGGDVVKVMASGGQITPNSPYGMRDPQFTGAELTVAVEEAHEHGVPVAVHAHGTEAIRRAVDAGADTIEHGTWLASNGGWDPRPEVADQMAKQGTVVCTASSNNWRGLARVIGEDRARELVGRTAWFEEHGVTQIVGTDAGLGAFTDTAAAVARLAEQGFSSGRAIEIATVVGARSLGLAATTGALRAGLAADLLVVEGDPLEDLHVLTQPLLVFAQGQSREPTAEAD